jgi:hypothetical protein
MNSASLGQVKMFHILANTHNRCVAMLLHMVGLAKIHGFHGDAGVHAAGDRWTITIAHDGDIVAIADGG